MTELNFTEEKQLYQEIWDTYQDIEDTDKLTAYELMKKSLALADRFSDIFYQLRKMEKAKLIKDPALKDRIRDREKYLREINQEARMIWNRKEEV